MQLPNYQKNESKNLNKAFKNTNFFANQFDLCFRLKKKKFECICSMFLRNPYENCWTLKETLMKFIQEANPVILSSVPNQSNMRYSESLYILTDWICSCFEIQLKTLILSVCQNSIVYSTNLIGSIFDLFCLKQALDIDDNLLCSYIDKLIRDTIYLDKKKNTNSRMLKLFSEFYEILGFIGYNKGWRNCALATLSNELKSDPKTPKVFIDSFASLASVNIFDKIYSKLHFLKQRYGYEMISSLQTLLGTRSCLKNNFFNNSLTDRKESNRNSMFQDLYEQNLIDLVNSTLIKIDLIKAKLVHTTSVDDETRWANNLSKMKSQLIVYINESSKKTQQNNRFEDFITLSVEDVNPNTYNNHKNSSVRSSSSMNYLGDFCEKNDVSRGNHASREDIDFTINHDDIAVDSSSKIDKMLNEFQKIKQSFSIQKNSNNLSHCVNEPKNFLNEKYDETHHSEPSDLIPIIPDKTVISYDKLYKLRLLDGLLNIYGQNTKSFFGAIVLSICNSLINSINNGIKLLSNLDNWINLLSLLAYIPRIKQNVNYIICQRLLNEVIHEKYSNEHTTMYVLSRYSWRCNASFKFNANEFNESKKLEDYEDLSYSDDFLPNDIDEDDLILAEMIEEAQKTHKNHSGENSYHYQYSNISRQNSSKHQNLPHETYKNKKFDINARKFAHQNVSSPNSSTSRDHEFNENFKFILYNHFKDIYQDYQDLNQEKIFIPCNKLTKVELSINERAEDGRCKSIAVNALSAEIILQIDFCLKNNIDIEERIAELGIKLSKYREILAELIQKKVISINQNMIEFCFDSN